MLGSKHAVVHQLLVACGNVDWRLAALIERKRANVECIPNSVQQPYKGEELLKTSTA